MKLSLPGGRRIQVDRHPLEPRLVAQPGHDHLGVRVETGGGHGSSGRDRGPRCGSHAWARPWRGSCGARSRIVHGVAGRVTCAPPQAATRARAGRRARRTGQSRLRARPLMIRAAAASFHTGKGSASQKAEAAMPNTGTSRAMGVTVARRRRSRVPGQEPAPGGVAEQAVADRLPDDRRPGGRVRAHDAVADRRPAVEHPAKGPAAAARRTGSTRPHRPAC